MLKSLFALLLGVALLAPAAGFAAPQTEARKAADYLAVRQLPNGAFGNEKAPADAVAETMSAMLSVDNFRAETENALKYLRVDGPARAAKQGAYAARIIMGLQSAGADPRNWGFDYVAQLDAFYDNSSGSYDSSNVYSASLALLGVAATGRIPPPKAIQFIRQQECPSGGFSHQMGCTALPDTDTSAIALNALIASGVSITEGVVQRTVAFLRAVQNEDGGFGAQPFALENPTNANSTGLVVSALSAAGEDARSWSKNSNNPVSALLLLQVSSGGFKYLASSKDAQIYATVQAIPGITLSAYPLRSASSQPTSSSPTMPASKSKNAIRPSDPHPPMAITHEVGETGPTTVGAAVPDTPSVRAGQQKLIADSKAGGRELAWVSLSLLALTSFLTIGTRRFRRSPN